MLTTISLSVLGAAYLFGGLVNWLIAAVEMLGNTTSNVYLDSVNNFSKRGVFNEVATVAYLFLAWPLHLALKTAFKPEA
jgi:hypothetical protein